MVTTICKLARWSIDEKWNQRRKLRGVYSFLIHLEVNSNIQLKIASKFIYLFFRCNWYRNNFSGLILFTRKSLLDAHIASTLINNNQFSGTFSSVLCWNVFHVRKKYLKFLIRASYKSHFWSQRSFYKFLLSDDRWAFDRGATNDTVFVLGTLMEVAALYRLLVSRIIV